MKKYFYADGSNNLGPYTLEELREKNINRGTKVWFQEPGEWKPAGDIPELTDLFNFPPSVPAANAPIEDPLNKQAPPKTSLAESILATLLCCLPFGIVGIVNAAKVESKFYGGDFEGASKASEEAKRWTSLSFWVGLLVGFIYFIFRIFSDRV